ncbi:hypothetical protein ACW5F0_05790 [Luteimonas sp. A534]
MSRLPADASAGVRPRAIDTIAGAMLGLAMLLLLHRNWGIDHDAALYLGQGLLLRWPEIFGNDLFFLHGGQGRYTVFPWLLAQTFDSIDPARLFLWGGLAGLLLFAATAWHCLSALLPPAQRYWAWLGVLCLPSMYGVTAIFSYAEPFLTARPVAEALCLLCIGFLARGRVAIALACLALAGLLHPLQAIAAALVVWPWLVMQDRRWIHAAWAAIPLILLAFAGVEPFDGLVRRIDPVWLSELRTFNGQLFLTGWSGRNLLLLLFDALVLGYAWRSLKGPFGGWCAAALAGLGIGLLANLVLVDGLSLVLPAGLQLWRVDWLAHLLAVASLAALLFRDLQAKDLQRALLLTLVTLLVWATTQPAWLLFALLYAAWPNVARVMRPSLVRMLGWLFGLGAAALLVRHVATELIAFGLAQYRLDQYAFDRRLLIFPILALGLPLLCTWIWNRLACKSMQLLGIAALCPLLLVAAVRWDARTALAQAIEENAFRSDLFGVQLPEDAQVFWDRVGLVGPWLALQRADYFSPQQLSGVAFSRNTALDGRERIARLAPLLGDSLACQKGTAPRVEGEPCRISDDSMRLACGPGVGQAPDYLVLPYRQRQSSLGTWEVSDPVTAAPIFMFDLYRCEDVMMELAPTGEGTARDR